MQKLICVLIVILNALPVSRFEDRSQAENLMARYIQIVGNLPQLA